MLGGAVEDKYFWLEPAYKKLIVFDIFTAAAEDYHIQIS